MTRIYIEPDIFQLKEAIKFVFSQSTTDQITMAKLVDRIHENYPTYNVSVTRIIKLIPEARSELELETRILESNKDLGTIKIRDTITPVEYGEKNEAEKKKKTTGKKKRKREPIEEKEEEESLGDVDDEGEFVAIGKGDLKRVTVSTFKNKKRVDIRNYYAVDGGVKPTKKGFSFSLEEYKKFIAPETQKAIQKLIDKAK